jgi:hypothetical protein
MLTAFFLVEGEPKGTSSRQRAARRITVFLNSAASEGAPFVSKFCNECRTQALTGKNPRRRWVNRDPGAIRLFSASTLKRAIMWPVRKVDITDSERQTVERFFCKKEPLSSRVTKSIREYFRTLGPTLRKSRSDPCFPLPTRRACLEEKEGPGVLAALRAHASRHCTKKVDGPEVRRRMEPSFPGGCMFMLPGMEETDVYLRAEEKLDHLAPMLADVGYRVHTDNSNSYSARASGVSTITQTRIPTTAREWAEYVLNQLPTTPRKLKPLGLVESGGKIRVATLHDCITVHAARVLTRASLGPLKTLRSTRDILTGREIELQPADALHGGLLYSADLSAATDHISHELAQELWNAYGRELRLPERLMEAGRVVLGPQLVEGLEERGPTTCGVHMGLGLSWPLLCLVNGWAAWDAGARKETYAICGDDLIGHWTPRLCDRYERNLEDAGLVVNKSKSFRGPRGVFCERRVQIDKDGLARSTTCVTMAEAAAAKHGWGAGETWAAVGEHLEGVLRQATQGRRSNKDPLLPLASRSLAKISCRKAPAGPIALSGRGGSGPSEAQLAGLLITGGGRYKPPAPRKERDLHRSFSKEVEASPTPWKGESLPRTKAHEVLVTAIGILRGKEQEKARQHAARYTQHARTGRELITLGKAALKGETLEEMVKRTSRLSNSAKRRILQRLRWRRCSHSRSRGLWAVWNMIQAGKPETHVRAWEFADLLGGLGLEVPEPMGAFRRGKVGPE